MIIRGIRGAKIKDEVFNIKEKQLLNAKFIATERHILQAIYQAKTKKNIAKDFWMEILVRASGRRQINEAIRIFGAKDGDICVVCKDEETFKKIHNIVGGEVDNSVLDLNEEKEKAIRNIFKIKGYGSTVERVLEKIALMEVKKE
ncbi:KEOPS complex subunit Cgi121 [Methanocaldococcus indicus]|uniref:KEOPS complex subunit Cgi121 n=1 Tax=Methanocaldococcus indicus TaxID=213231 RepID=UPI003C6CECF2